MKLRKLLDILGFWNAWYFASTGTIPLSMLRMKSTSALFVVL